VTREQKAVDWRELAKTLTPRTQAFIDGKYRPAVSGATFDCINPANGQVSRRSRPAMAPTSNLRSRARASRSRRAAGRAARLPRARKCCCASPS
jgi:acyl-CoA reductase-like NAD-dependent aldehyde dehydrogenase